MNTFAPNADRLFELAGAIFNQNASEADIVELDAILRTDDTFRMRYLDYCQLHASLKLQARAHQAASTVCQKILDCSKSECSLLLNKAESDSEPTGVFSIALHAPFTSLSSGWPVAYLIATVIFGIGIMIGAFTYVSQPAQVAQESQVLLKDSAASTSQMQVGRITGMVHCRWTDASSGPRTKPLEIGSTCDLISGLLEITYDTGAKVILEGPVVYQVASKNGGFLAVGKLTGKVEGDAAKGFSIGTPTTIITDLGTEFGVEVGQQGDTKARVFRGSVKVQRIAIEGKPENDGQVLLENESIHMGHGDGKQDVVILSTSVASEFVRELPKENVSQIKVFDLVDVVAGGDGFSGRRNAGIDLTTGQPTKTPPPYDYFDGDDQYHRVDAMPFVDGVFIPNGHNGKVQIDSEGHRFDGFAATDGKTACYLWAGGIRPTHQPYPTPGELGGVDYALPGHGLLEMHANKGVTFDLDAIRRSNPGWRLLRFRAVVGNTETASQAGGIASADIWVLVDGKIRFRRREINYYNGAMPVDIAIRDADRFLTLAATDGGNGFVADWTMFGDPRLELVAVGESTNSATVKRSAQQHTGE